MEDEDDYTMPEPSECSYNRFARRRDGDEPDPRFSENRIVARREPNNNPPVDDSDDVSSNHSQSLPSEEEDDDDARPRRGDNRGPRQRAAADNQQAGVVARYSEPVGCKRQRLHSRAAAVAVAAARVDPKLEGYWRTIDPLRCLPVSRSALLGTERPHDDLALRFDKIMGTRMIKGMVYAANTDAFNAGGGQEGAVRAQQQQHREQAKAKSKKPEDIYERIAASEDGCTAWIALLVSKVLKKVLGRPNVQAIADALEAVVEGKLPFEQLLTIDELTMELPLSKQIFPVRTCTLSTAREADAGIELDGTVLRLDGGLGSYVRVPHADVQKGGRVRLSCTLRPRPPLSPAPSQRAPSEVPSQRAPSEVPPSESPLAALPAPPAKPPEPSQEPIRCAVVIDAKGVHLDGEHAERSDDCELSDRTVLQTLFSPWTWPFREVVRVRAMHSAREFRSELQLDPLRAVVMLAGMGGNPSRWADALFLMADELILCEMTRSTRGVDKYEFYFCDESTCRWALDVGDVEYRRMLTRMRKAIAGMTHDLERTAQLARDCLEQNRMNEDEIMALCAQMPDQTVFEGATMENRRDILLSDDDNDIFKKTLRKLLPQWHPDGKCRAIKNWVIRERFAAALVASQPKGATVFDDSNLFAFEDGMAYDPTRAVYRRLTPQDRISLSCGYDAPQHVSEAEKEEMLSVMRQIHPRPEVLNYKLDLKARCLDASPGHPIILAAIGNAGGGKGFENAITKGAFGKPYAKTIDKNLLLDNNSNPEAASPKLAELHNLRLIAADEVKQVDANTIKRLTGGDTISARPLFGKPIEFIAKFFLVELYANFKDTEDGETIRCDSDGGITRRLRAIRFTSQFVDASNADEGAANQAEYDREYTEALASGGESPPRKFAMWKERAEEIISKANVLMAILIERHQKAQTAGWAEVPAIVGEWTSAFQSTSAKPLDDVLCKWYERCPCKPRSGVTQPSTNDLVFENTGLSCPHTVRLEDMRLRLQTFTVGDGNRSKLDVVYGIQAKNTHRPLIAALDKTRCIPCAAKEQKTDAEAEAARQPDAVMRSRRAKDVPITTEFLRLVVNERYARTNGQRNVLCGLLVKSPTDEEAKHANDAFEFAKKANEKALEKMSVQSTVGDRNPMQIDDVAANAATAAAEAAAEAAQAARAGEGYEPLDEDP